MSKNIKNSRVLDLAKYLFNELSPESQAEHLKTTLAQPSGEEGVDDIIPNSVDAAINPEEGISMGQLGKLALGAARQHPIKTMGLGALGLGNLGGFTDNNKFGGQLGGLALGGLGASYVAKDPYIAALMTLGGGQLGALFDKLRANRESQRNQISQQQQVRR